ncbi:alpha/beta fold hydrolase [Temperatibacter marinus]|uniref:Alpha/beta fold hydrolase n=1 Tax=Temperatibacter marinus TaxID=1456591 RepID=A0AA52H9X3_9PROT|nr:alpha/beta fold hydrolase [Temperatibacter marinus]WND02135.1 alpha/beta fold hydrolase [Temperatibacter marinus]
MLKCDTLVFVPGLMGTHLMWEIQEEALKDHMNVIVANTRKDTSIADMATRLLDTVQGNFAICGLSMGGYVALEVLAQASERVSHYALLDTNAHADSEEAKSKREQGIKLSEEGKFEDVVNAFLPTILGERARTDDTILKMLRKQCDDTGMQGFIRQQKAIMGRKNHLDLLAEHSQPSLILCGKEDMLTPPHLHYEMVERLPNSDFQLLGDCGHISSMERPNAVLSALINLMHRT